MSFAKAIPGTLVVHSLSCRKLIPARARVVELRYFGGLSVEETAAALGISVETVTRDLRLARGWLLTQIADCRP